MDDYIWLGLLKDRDQRRERGDVAVVVGYRWGGVSVARRVEVENGDLGGVGIV